MGLALSLALVAVLAAGAATAGRRVDRPALVLAVCWRSSRPCAMPAGSSRPVAARAPRIVLLLSLAVVLGFSLTNPDGRIGASVVSRAAADRSIDRDFVRGRSADAVHQLWRIPRADGGASLWVPIERRLERADGIARFNVGR